MSFASKFQQLQALAAAKDHAGAMGLAARLVADRSLRPEERAAVFRVRSILHEQRKDVAAALADAEAAFALVPRDPKLANEVGILRVDAGQREGAAAAFQRATELDPRYARAWNNLGAAMLALGDPARAVSAYERSVSVQPDYAIGWANLGIAYRDAGDFDRAVDALRRSLAIDPRLRVAMMTLASIYRIRGDVDTTIGLYERALAADPSYADAWLLLAHTLTERDDLVRARDAFARAESLDPSLLRALFGRELSLPMVVESEEALHAARSRYIEGLATVARELPTRAAPLSTDKLLDELRWINWLLPYQGEDEKPLQAAYAGAIGSVLERQAPEWRNLLPPRAARERIRVGFVSGFFRDGTVGRYFEHWITDLPRERFEVVLYQLNPHSDELTARLAQRADAYRLFPLWRTSQVAPRIREDALDVLVYPELGLEPVSFALAALRLAPLQCAAWGHPVTTGHATIDVFFSSDRMEPPDGASHYTERLVTFPGIGTRYAKPAIPDDATRARFGLRDDRVLFLCPQSHYKIHPSTDDLYARVLAAVPAADLVLFDGRHPALTEVCLARMRAALARHGVAPERLVVIRQCPHDDYMRINVVCDAMLDTLRWSGGNTSLDAIAAGLPIVTLPGRFMRGRQSAAMLELAGVPELVAADEDDYVRIASRLAGDAGWRTSLRARIAEGRSGVFDDRRAIDAFIAFLRENTGSR